MQLRNNEETLKKYIDQFPESKESFVEYEKDIIDLGRKIHRTYLDKRVYKTITSVPFQFKKILYKLHGNYLSTKEVVTFNHVMDVIDTLDAKLLCFIYNKTVEQQIVPNSSSNYQPLPIEDPGDELMVEGTSIVNNGQMSYAQVAASNQSSEQVTESV